MVHFHLYLYHIQILPQKKNMQSLYVSTNSPPKKITTFRPNDFNNPQTTNSFPLWIGVSLWRFIQGTPTKPPRSAPSSATNHSWRVVLPRVEELEPKVMKVWFRWFSFPIGWFFSLQSLIFQGGVAYNVHTYIEYTLYRVQKTTPSSSVQWFLGKCVWSCTVHYIQSLLVSMPNRFGGVILTSPKKKGLQNDEFSPPFLWCFYQPCNVAIGRPVAKTFTILSWLVVVSTHLKNIRPNWIISPGSGKKKNVPS